MTLADGHSIHSQLFRADRLLERLGEPLGGRDLVTGDRIGAVGDDVEQLEPHADTPGATSSAFELTRASGVFSPASMPIGRRLASGGSGHVAKSVYAHGRLTARLKSIAVQPSASGASMPTDRFAA